jgi:hypothetical protein
VDLRAQHRPVAPVDHLDPGLAQLLQRELEGKLGPGLGSGSLEARHGQDTPYRRIDEPGAPGSQRRVIGTGR